MNIVVAGGRGGLGTAIVDELLFRGIQKDMPDELYILDRDETKVPDCDVFIYNCGIGYFDEIDKLTKEQIDQMLSVNLYRAIYLTRDIVAKMKNKKSGHIIFTGSNSALKGISKNSVYACTKAGLLALQRCLELECKSYGIKVSIINPGTIDTDGFWSHGIDNRDKGTLKPTDVAEIYANLINVGLSTEIRVEP